MNKIVLVIIGVLFIGVLGIFLRTRLFGDLRTENDGNKLQVTASFYPLAEFARQVGGARVSVLNITPVGSEPHDFDPSPKDLVTLQESKVFIYNGLGFEPWVNKVIPDLEDKGVKIIDASLGIIPFPAQDGEEEHESEEEEYSLYDPHVWLDPSNASKQVDNIMKALIEVDSANKEYYETNASKYKGLLEELDQEYKEGLENCNRREVVVSHNAFSYLANRYNLNVITISGLSPDEEPSPQRLAEIVEFAKSNNVSYIFFETLVDPRLSKTIAEEIGAKTLVLNPIEGLIEEEINKREDYISVSKENLDNLKVALNCK